MSLPGLDEFKTGLMTRVADFLSVAQSSLLKTVWRDPTASKPAGDLSAMLYDLEQELQSISLRLELLAQITGQDSLRVARAHLEKSIVALTNNSDAEAYTRTEQ
jgi:hypothetical protein